MEPTIVAANKTPPVGSARAQPRGLLDVQEIRGNEGRKPGLGSGLWLGFISFLVGDFGENPSLAESREWSVLAVLGKVLEGEI